MTFLKGLEKRDSTTDSCGVSSLFAKELLRGPLTEKGNVKKTLTQPVYRSAWIGVNVATVEPHGEAPPLCSELEIEVELFIRVPIPKGLS